MRIVLDARYLDGTFSGIATYSQALITHLARVDTENEYLVIVRPGFVESSFSPGPNFSFLTWRPKPISLKSYFAAAKHFERLSPDVLHTLAPHAPVFYRGAMAITVHDMQPFLDPHFSGGRLPPLTAGYNLFYRWAYPAAVSRAKWVLCDSYATRDDVVRLMPWAREKLLVVRPGLEPRTGEPPTAAHIEAIRAKLGLRGRYVLYYGSTRPNKNLPNQVKAFARLVRSAPQMFDDLRLVLVLRRDRFYSDVSRAITSRKLHDRVLVLDPMPQAELEALLAGASLFTFVTKHEGFGYPPLEAMRAGIPVLAGESGSLPEVLGDAALFADPDELDDIAARMEALLTDEPMRRRLVMKGHGRVGMFSWDETAETVRDLYHLLI